MAVQSNIVAIVQARMGSSRLPGKVLMMAAGQTLLEHLMERLSFTSRLDQQIVATSTTSKDDAIAQLCLQRGIECFRGSEEDVLDRYYRTALTYEADAVVRITADCPLIDPYLVDHIVDFFVDHENEYDLVTNRHPLTFPDGLDVDVMPLASLQKVWEQASEPHQLEHVIPYFWESGMRVANIEDPSNNFLRHRWTVDYEEDYKLVKAIFEALYKPGKVFVTQEIIEFLANRPDLASINSKYISARN